MANILRKSESQWGAPSGVYQARFLGLFPMTESKTPRLGVDGRPMPPGVEWRFQVIEGEYADRMVTRITGTTPTARNACGQLLDGLCGRTLASGEAADVDAYIGRTFAVVVGKSTTNPDRTQVVQVMPPPAPARRKPPVKAMPAPPPPLAVDDDSDDDDELKPDDSSEEGAL